MTTLAHITLSEFEALAQNAKIPVDTRLTITIEDERISLEIAKRQKTLLAMKKLRGSGNGNLVEVLLKERQKDKKL